MAEEKENFTINFTKKIKGLYIDPKIFTFGFSCNCSGECCHYGVYTDLKEHDSILIMKDRLLSLFDDTQCRDLEKWFEPPEEDEDFDETDPYELEWFHGSCDICNLKLAKKNYAVRVPLSSGGFSGCYCDWSHAKLDVPIDSDDLSSNSVVIYSLIDKFEQEINEKGIYDRSY